MSTKIHNGFKLKGIKTLDKAFFLMPELRKTIQAAVLQRTAKLLAERACFIYDEATMKGETLGLPALAVARRAIDEDLMESGKQRRRCYYDLGFDVSLAITTDKTVIGMVFCEDRDIRKLFFEHESVEEYAYYDNTDEPDDMPVKEWRKRRGHWNEVLGASSVPAETMFNIRFVQEYTLPYPDRELVESNIISFEKRLHHVAERITMDKACEKFELTTPGSVMAFMMRNPEYKIMLDAEKSTLADRLKQQLTIEDLQENI